MMKTKADPASGALGLPSGARFYRCALQVNPFGYLARRKKQTRFETETDYNDAIIQACRDRNIEVIAVTDHYRVCSSTSLVESAKTAGILVFPGFEAVTKDGVHFLCLFDPAKDLDALERVLGDCGLHDEDEPSPTGKYDTLELLEESKKWGAACVADHVAGRGGLLATLSGQARINAWTSPDLLACCLPGPVLDALDNLRPILENKNAEHRREQALATINAQDVSNPADLQKPGASCWIKESAKADLPPRTLRGGGCVSGSTQGGRAVAS